MPDEPASDLLNDQVRAAMESAVASAWAFFERAAANGFDWDDIAGCATLADYRARLAAEPGQLLETCQALLEYDNGLTPGERADCRRVVAIADALALRGPPLPPRAAPPAVAAEPEPAPAASSAAREEAPTPVEPAQPVSRRLGYWPSVIVLLLGIAAALGWLWSTRPQQPLPPATPRAAAGSATGSATVGPDPSAAPSPPAAVAKPTPRPAPSVQASPRHSPVGRTPSEAPPSSPAPRPSDPAPRAPSSDPARPAPPAPVIRLPAPAAAPQASPSAAPSPSPAAGAG